jgi:hypothetical protein
MMDIAMYGIKKVVFRDFYLRDEKSFEIANFYGIQMVQI